MKRFLALLLLSFILPSLAFTQQVPGSSTLWERAAYGNISGLQLVNLKGWNPAITTTFEDVSPESSAIAIPISSDLVSPYCASTSANDTAAGTGARTISLTLVTTDFAQVTETVTLNGTTSVNLTTPGVLGFNAMSVSTTGTTLGNEGVIDCGTGTNTAGSAAVAYVTLGVFSATAVPAAGVGGANVAEIFQYVVPSGKTLLCRNISIGSVFATAASGIDAVIDGSTNRGILKRFWFRMIHNTGTNPSNAADIVKFPQKTYLKGRVAGVTGSNTGPVSMSAECLLIDNTWALSSQIIF